MDVKSRFQSYWSKDTQKLGIVIAVISSFFILLYLLYYNKNIFMDKTHFSIFNQLNNLLNRYSSWFALSRDEWKFIAFITPWRPLEDEKESL